jgi:hypothetical protein
MGLRTEVGGKLVAIECQVAINCFVGQRNSPTDEEP